MCVRNEKERLALFQIEHMVCYSGRDKDMSSYAKNVASYTNPSVTPQNEIIPGREDAMVMNNAGGAVFSLNDWLRLDRFLILGTEGGSFYVKERALTLDMAKAVQRCIKLDGIRVVNRTVEISDAGRARKNEQALFVLAMASASDDQKVRRAALSALPKVARIGTHLFQFAEFVKNFRGYGRALRNAIGNWYLNMPVDKLALQAVKYQQRNGWSHRDMLRLAHPHTLDSARNNILNFMVSRDTKLTVDTGNLFIGAYQEIQKLDKTDVATAVNLIQQYNLPREAIPTEFLSSPDVWSVLLDHMPMTAMIRNLGKMSEVGILDPLSSGAGKVISSLSDTDLLRKARIHPMQVLDALLVYNSGKGVLGSLTWPINQQIVDALNDAFYGTFQFVEPTGKNLLLSIDCSGSMDSLVSGSKVLSCRTASAALALVTANVETNYEIVGFSSGDGWAEKGSKRHGWYGSGIQALNISPKMRLDQVTNIMSKFAWGGTDVSLPAKYAQAFKRSIDAFITITDNETWAGDQHPTQALVNYRQSSGIAAKQIIVGMTCSDFTVSDPDDAYQLDVVGFDASCPAVISTFIAS